MEMEKISSSLEDYLEAIAEIIEDNGHAHTKDIADKLHVKMPSVTSALQTLSAKGLIRYQSHAPVVLTAAGSERAAVIRLRHAAFNNFFREILKLSPEEANDTACKVEHIVCEKVMSRFVSLTDAIMQRSDCAELRKYLEQTMPQICSDSTEDLVSLDQLAVGQNAHVARLTAQGVQRRRMLDLGFVPGALVGSLQESPCGDPVAYSIRGAVIALRRQDAEKISISL